MAVVNMYNQWWYFWAGFWSTAYITLHTSHTDTLVKYFDAFHDVLCSPCFALHHHNHNHITSLTGRYSVRLAFITSQVTGITSHLSLTVRYSEELSAALQLRPHKGYHVPRMVVIPPGLDFTNLKVDMPTDPWEALLGPASHGHGVTAGHAVSPFQSAAVSRRSSYHGIGVLAAEPAAAEPAGR